MVLPEYFILHVVVRARERTHAGASVNGHSSRVTVCEPSEPAPNRDLFSSDHDQVDAVFAVVRLFFVIAENLYSGRTSILGTIGECMGLNAQKPYRLRLHLTRRLQ